MPKSEKSELFNLAAPSNLLRKKGRREREGEKKGLGTRHSVVRAFC